MAISRVGSVYADHGSSYGDSTDLTLASVTSGNLVVVYAGRRSGGANPAIVAGNLTKTSGSATIGTVTIDSQTLGAGSAAGVFSVPITGNGNLTLTLAAVTDCCWYGCMEQLTGVDVTASRKADSDVGNGTGNNPATADAVSGAAGIFCGCFAAEVSSAVTITQDAAFTLVYEDEAGGGGTLTFAAAERIVTGNTTDAATWTTSGIDAQGWAAAVAVLKEAGGAPPAAGSIVPTITL